MFCFLMIFHLSSSIIYFRPTWIIDSSFYIVLLLWLFCMNVLFKELLSLAYHGYAVFIKISGLNSVSKNYKKVMLPITWMSMCCWVILPLYYFCLCLIFCLWSVTVNIMNNLLFFLHCVSKKNVLTLKRYSSKLYGSILTSFGRNVQNTPE